MVNLFVSIFQGSFLLQPFTEYLLQKVFLFLSQILSSFKPSRLVSFIFHYRKMGVIQVSHSLRSKVSPSRMFKAMILDSHNLVPQLMFSSIKNIQFLQGQGQPGTIKQINFTEASPYNYAKHRIDAIDEEKFMCRYTFIDGDALADKLDHITYEVKFEAYGYGGCLCKMTSEYCIKENVEIKEEDIERGKDRAIGMWEVVEAYLLAHPHVYA